MAKPKKNAYRPFIEKINDSVYSKNNMYTETDRWPKVEKSLDKHLSSFRERQKRRGNTYEEA